MTALRRCPAAIHPLLFAIYPALALYTRNADVSRPEHLIWPVVLSLAGAAVVLTISAICLKNVQRAAIIASTAVILFFFLRPPLFLHQ